MNSRIKEGEGKRITNYKENLKGFLGIIEQISLLSLPNNSLVTRIKKFNLDTWCIIGFQL